MFPLFVSTNLVKSVLNSVFNTLRAMQVSQVLTLNVCKYLVPSVLQVRELSILCVSFLVIFGFYELSCQRQINTSATSGCFQFVSSDNFSTFFTTPHEGVLAAFQHVRGGV